MLVLSRKSGESIVIGDQIKLSVVRVSGNRVRLGIEAPDDVTVLRGELAVYESIPADDPAPRLPRVELETEERGFSSVS